MKIRISEDEVYEIKLPEEIGIQNFSAIVSKFNFLLKNFTKFSIGEEASNQDKEIVINPSVYKKHNKNRWTILRDNRDIYIELLKTHYLGTSEEFDNLAKKYEITATKKDLASAMGIALREMHKVKPEEVGLKGFPTKTIQVKHLILEKQK